MSLKKTILILVVFSLFLITVPSAYAGCCIGPSGSAPPSAYGNLNDDPTCTDIPQSQCPAGYSYDPSQDCRKVPQCGCCVANPQTQNPQIYSIPNYLSTQGFCQLYFPNLPVTIVPNMSSAQCSSLIGKPGPISTANITAPGGFGNIRGTISSGGILLSGVAVDLISANVVVDTQKTNSQGGFAFLSKQFASYSLRVESCGYLTKTESVDLSSSEIVRIIILDLAQKERIVIDVLDSANNKLNNVSFQITPSVSGLQIPNSQNGLSTVPQIASNCNYNISAIYLSNILSQKIFLDSGDGITDNSMKFTFPISGDPCLGVTDCRGPDQVLAQGIDCTQLCTGTNICDASTGQCTPPKGAECCSYGFQCDKNSTLSSLPSSCSANKIACSKECKYVPQCPNNVDMSIGSSGYLCECLNSLAEIKSASPSGGILALGKFCCTGNIVNNVCQYGTHVRIFGTVNGNLGPVTAEIIVDKGSSDEKTYYTDSSGIYEIFLESGKAHKIDFQKAPSHTSASRSISALPSGNQQRMDITLLSPTGICSSPQSPLVPGFTAQHVSGEASALLAWDNSYCGSATPSLFRITNEITKQIVFVDGKSKSYKLENLDWDKTYTFSIRALYTDGNNNRLSYNESLSQPFDPGDKECEGKASNQEFCSTLTLRQRCTVSNELSSLVDTSRHPSDCANYKKSGQINDWICSLGASSGTTQCLEQTACGYQPSRFSSLPFTNIPFLGLLFNNELCSGGTFTSSKACYLDSSSTSVDFCVQCPVLGSSSYNCATYRSESACMANKCGILSQCAWDQSAFGEFGKGLCYDKSKTSPIKFEQKESKGVSKFSSESRCSVCSSDGPLFSNVGCAQDLCSELGSCYSENGTLGLSCSQCLFGPNKFTSCSDFKSPSSCINATGQNRGFSEVSGKYIFSDDACGIGRCIWNGNSCFKDGDANGLADCRDSLGNILPVCENDIDSPVSKPLINSSFLNKDLNNPRNLLEFNISEKISKFSFCLYKNGDSPCLNFANVSGNLVSGSVKINPLTQFGNVVNENNAYRLRYFAEDLNKNREEIKEITLLIDPDKPRIFADFETSCINCDKDIDCSKRESYLSSARLSLFSDEQVSCSDKLEGAGSGIISVPLTSQKPFTLSPTINEIHIYGSANGLKDGNYVYTLTCEDQAGNREVIKKFIEMDSNRIIKSASPKRALANTNITYMVESNSPSQCSIRIGTPFTNGLGSPLLLESKNNLFHSKNLPSQQGVNYFYEIFCSEINPLSKNRCDTELEQYSIDLQSPVTKAIVGFREETSSSWISSQVYPVELILLAEDPGIDGINFGINSTVYCTSSGVSCNPDLVGSRVFYPDQIKLQASNNLGICYYSIDNGGNKENTKCGRILFDTPPAVLITSPANLLVIGSDSIAVTGSHNAQSVNQSQIFISNGSLSRTVPIPRTANTFNQNVTLYDGKNIISVQVTNVAGVTGEETREVYYDKTGPEIIFSSSSLVEYGQSFDLQASISDEKWTIISSRDNVGQIKNSTKAIIQSVVSNLSV